MLQLMRVSHTIILGFILLLTGCGSILQQDDQTADGTAASLKVLQRENYPSEESYLRSLVEHLESPEVVIRMVAISSLQEVTGKTHGYQYASSISERMVAVKKWVTWLSAQQWDSEFNLLNQDKDNIDA